MLYLKYVSWKIESAPEYFRWKSYITDVCQSIFLTYWIWHWQIHAFLEATFYKQQEAQGLIRYLLLYHKKLLHSKTKIRELEWELHFLKFHAKNKQQWSSLMMLMRKTRVEKLYPETTLLNISLYWTSFKT